MTQSPLFRPLKKDKKIFEQISDQIRELIFSGVLRPDDKLPSEKELSIQFNTGRMVVREALRTLEQSGLVYVKQGSKGGAFVKDLDTTVITRSISDLIKIGNVTLLELTEARLEIEKIVLDFAARKIDNDGLDLLRKNIEESEELISKGLRASNIYLDFHLLLAKSSKNSVFELILKPVMDIVSSYLRQVEPSKEYSYRVLTYHKEIYKAIEEKNIARAKEKMENHLLDVKNQLLSLLGD
jgi:GntR family transcriptional repressor for pyruvate dehydrogenase complex